MSVSRVKSGLQIFDTKQIVDSGDVGMVGEAVTASLAADFAATFKCLLERESDVLELTVRAYSLNFAELIWQNDS